MPAFGAGCDTSIHTSPCDAGPSIHGGAGMSVTTIVALVAHPPSGAGRRAGSSLSERWTSDSCVPSGRGSSRETRSASSPAVLTFSAIVVNSRSNAESVKQVILDDVPAMTERSASTAAVNRVVPFCCVLMLAERSTSTRTPVPTERSTSALPRQCGTARRSSKTTDNCK